MVEQAYLITAVPKDRLMELLDLSAKATPGSVIWCDSEEEMQALMDMQRITLSGRAISVRNP